LVKDEIETFKRDLVTPEELEKAKKAVIARSIFGKGTASSLASSLASSYMETGDPYYDEKYVDEIRRVTPEQIRDAAKGYLLMDRMSVAVTKPSNNTVPPPAAIKAKEAAAVSTPDFRLLDNGLKLLVKRDSSLPVVNIHLYGPGGLYMEDLDRPGLSSFTASLLTSGTTDRSRMDILNSIEGVGGAISAQSDNNTYHISLRVLKEDLDLALDVLSDIIRNTEFPPEEIEKTRKETLLAIQKRDESWQAEVVRLFKKAYFSRASYINDHLGTTESVRSFSREDVQAFYRRMVNPRHSVLAVYGDIDTDQVQTRVSKMFGGWTGEKVALSEGPDETQQLNANRSVEKTSDKSSPALFMGTNGLSIGSPDRPILDVIDSILSGSGSGGRLFEALRGSQDLVYVVGASPFYGRGAGYYGILTQTTQANLDKVEGIINEHLQRLTEEPVPDDELQRTKEAIITSHQLGRESLDSQAQQAALGEALGMGWDYDKHYLEQVRSVTSADIQRLATKLFGKKLVARTLPENPVEILASPPINTGTATP
jgi:zinc protease